MVKTYSTGGKARKKCPNCAKFVHARCLSCICGHKFVKGVAKVTKKAKAVNKDVKVYKKGGAGKKQCVPCKAYVGVRTSYCKCGYDFKRGSYKKSEEIPLTIEEIEGRALAKALGYSHVKKTITPAGLPYKKLTGNTYKKVAEWAEENVDIGLGNDQFLTLAALLYWVNHYFSQHENAPKHLRK
jgi:hypothetical protein